MSDGFTLKECPHCGSEGRSDAKFCMKCGAAFDGSSAPAQDGALSQDSAYVKANAIDGARASNAKAGSKGGKADGVKDAGKAGGKVKDKASSSKKSSMSTGKKATIIAVSVVVALLLVLGIALLSAPKGTTDVGKGYEVSGQRIAFSDGAYVMTGSVKNTTGHDEAFTLTWQVFDKDDQEIGQASVTVGALKDGQSQEFKAQITSASSMFDLIFSGGQRVQTGGPDHFELKDVSLYTESMSQLSSSFENLFGGYSDLMF